MKLVSLEKFLSLGPSEQNVHFFLIVIESVFRDLLLVVLIVFLDTLYQRLLTMGLKGALAFLLRIFSH